MLKSPPHADLAPEQDVFVMPCSAAQVRFWMLDQISPGNTALVIPIAVQLSGPLQVELLHRALNAIVQRHETLRTSFALIDGEPKQVIAPELALKLGHLNLEDVPATEQQERLSQVMSEEARRPISLTDAPLLRATLVRLAPEEHALMLTAHHMVSDGWSNGLLVRELGLFYQAFLMNKPVDLAPLAIQYADYVLWQEEWLKSDGFDKQMDFWRKELAEEIPVLDFPTDFARKSGEDSGAILESRLLPGGLTESLKHLCREGGTTLFMIFFSAYLILLQRYTGQSRLLVGTTGANRNKPELEAIIGLFSNVLLLPSEISPEMTTRDFLTRERNHLLDSFANHEAPFERVMEGLQQKRGLPKLSVQTHFLFQKAFMQPMTCEGGLTIRPLYSVSPGSTFELTFGIVERAEGIRLQMEYRTSLYRRETIQRLLAHFQALLEAMAANPDMAIGDLPMLAENEREEMEAALIGGPVEVSPEPETLFQELDLRIDEHFQKTDDPFLPAAALPGDARMIALDEKLRALPVGIPGELYLADRANGWSGRSDAVRGPMNATAQVALLRTGFLGRNAEGGGVQLWGRDEDVMELPVFRGNRRAVEAKLRRHSDVAEVAVVAPRQATGERKLAAYVVLKPGGTATGESLRTFLRGKLSDLLVPSVIVVQQSLPKDETGRVILEHLKLPERETEKDASAFVPLQAALQNQLIEIWCDLLGTRGVGPHDNFFEIGGNSFLAMRMMVEAGKLCQRKLPLSLLLTGATVSNLAHYILTSGAEGEPKSVVPVQAKGTRTPLFFLHGDWVGGGFYSNQLARQLGNDQPFYALPPHRANERRTIREMAAEHRAAIREHSPKGPYVLGGYCIGALVAMEVSRQLMAEGETVTHLFLMDPPVLADPWLRALWPLFDRWGALWGWELSRRIQFFDRYAVAGNRWLRRPNAQKVAGVLRRILGGKGRASAAPQKESAAGGDPGNDTMTGLDYSLYFLAYRLHEIEELSVPTTVFVPESMPVERIPRMTRATKLDLAKYTVEVVPGDHTTCVTQDTSVMTEKMRAVLEAR